MSAPAPADDREGLPFGPRGLALAARAARAGVSLAGLDPARARIGVCAVALSEDEREALGPPLERPDGRWIFELSRERLEALVRSRPTLTPLAAAHVLATRPARGPRLMGVVNVTPDSFSDGGALRDARAAIDHGLRLVEAGAEVLDVGGESTRPGAPPVALEEELARVIPVVAGLAVESGVLISVDTSKARVAAEAMDAGAGMVNDVSAGRLDPELVPRVAERGAELVLMHMRGTPQDMQIDPRYDDVVDEVCEHLRERVAHAWSAGVPLPKIHVDPGIGFGKRLEDNLALIRALPELRSLGRPIVLGVSRKSFLGALGSIERAAERVTDTAAAVAAGVLFGAELLRVHDAASMAPALRVAAALADANARVSPPNAR